MTVLRRARAGVRAAQPAGGDAAGERPGAGARLQRLGGADGHVRPAAHHRAPHAEPAEADAHGDPGGIQPPPRRRPQGLHQVGAVAVFCALSAA